MTDVHAFIFSAADDVDDNVVDIGVSCRWLTDENVTVESGKGVREWGLNEIKRVKVKKTRKNVIHCEWGGNDNVISN